jgi:hypothetical protein
MLFEKSAQKARQKIPPDNSDYVIRGKTRARGFSQVEPISHYPPAQKIRLPSCHFNGQRPGSAQGTRRFA